MIIKFRHQEMKMIIDSMIGELMNLWAYIKKVEGFINYGATYKKTKKC